MTYSPDDIVERDSEVLYYVYELIDDAGAPFYVGCTHAPRTRLRQHIAGPGNVAVQAKLAAITTPRMRIVTGPLPLAAAQLEEERRIKATPALLNQEHKLTAPSRERHPAVIRFAEQTNAFHTPHV